jgi:hypothetical protein
VAVSDEPASGPVAVPDAVTGPGPVVGPVAVGPVAVRTVVLRTVVVGPVVLRTVVLRTVVLRTVVLRTLAVGPVAVRPVGARVRDRPGWGSGADGRGRRGDRGSDDRSPPGPRGEWNGGRRVG